MAISITNPAYNRSQVVTTATSHLIFTATTTTIHTDIVVIVALLTDTESVSGITDTALNTYYHRISQQGTGVRIEIWEAQNVAASGSNVVNVALTSAVKAAGGFIQYSNIVPEPSPPATTQDMTTAFSTTSLAGSGVAIQENGNWVVGGVAYIDADGLTGYTVDAGTMEIDAIPTPPGGVGLVILDAIGSAIETTPIRIQIGTTVNWASATLELRGGGSSIATPGVPPPEPVDPSNPTVIWSFSYVVTTPTYAPPQTATVECDFQGSNCGAPGPVQGNTGH